MMIYPPLRHSKPEDVDGNILLDSFEREIKRVFLGSYWYIDSQLMYGVFLESWL